MRRLVLILATLCVLRGEGRAEDGSLHLLGAAQLGFTDNLTSSSTDPEWDTYVGLRPGVLATYGTARTIHELMYTLDANLYARHSGLSTLFHTAGWRGFFITGPRSEVTTTVTGSYGDANLFPDVAISGGSITAQRSGLVQAASAEASANDSYMLTRDLRFGSGLSASYTRLDATGSGISTTEQVAGHVLLDKSFRYDALSINGTAQYLWLSQPIANAVGNFSDNQTNLRLSGMYRHDLDREWTTALEAGGVAVIPSNSNSKTALVAIGAAQLAYYPAWGTAGLSVRRDVAPNLLLAQNTVTDSAQVNAWLPLPWHKMAGAAPDWTVQGSVGVARVRLLDSVMGEAVSAFDDVLGDVALNWSLRRNALVTFRYQLVWQKADPSVLLPVEGFTRNTLLVQFTGRWPDRLAVTVPTRETLRVDRSNVTPVGEEVPGNGGGVTGGASGDR